MEIENNESLFRYTSPNNRDRFHEACAPGDEQGIPFNTPMIHFSREELRRRRMETYPSFRNEQFPLDEENEAEHTPAEFFEFQASYSNAPIRQEHFQLRNCIRVSPANIIYLTGPGQGDISSYDPLSEVSTPVITSKSNNMMKITTFSVMDNLLITGGMNGQLNIDTLDGEPRARHWLSEQSLGHITNSVDLLVFKGNREIMVGSNNKAVSFYDPDNLAIAKRTYTAQFNVNRVSLSPDQSLLAFVADELNGHVLSSDTMTHLFTLEGHKDYGFGVDFHPLKPHIIATGNQDRSIRVWDLRMASNSVVKPLTTVFGLMTSVLNTFFEAGGEYLVGCEAADFVHVIDATLFTEVQVIDFFGEIMGTAFSCESSHPASLFIGINDSSFSSLYEVRRLPSHPSSNFLI